MSETPDDDLDRELMKAPTAAVLAAVFDLPLPEQAMTTWAVTMNALIMMEVIDRAAMVATIREMLNEQFGPRDPPLYKLKPDPVRRT